MADEVTTAAATPSGVAIVARTPDGAEVNITEGVQCLYDLVINSMDWGSGFLTVEEALPVVHVAKTCNFADWEEAQRYVDTQQQSEEQARFIKTRREQGQFDWHGHPHDHVYSSLGKCMWPSCTATETEAPNA